MKSFKTRLAVVGRQFPWAYPRRVVKDAVAWVEARQRAAPWYERIRGCSYTPHQSPEVVTFCPPPDLPRCALRSLRGASSFVRPRTGLFHLFDVSLFSGEGTVLSRQNELFDEFSHAWSRTPVAARIYRRPFTVFRWNPRIVEETTAVLASPGGDNYYHWLFDVLPRLHLLRAVRPLVTYYALPAGLTAFQRETLRMLEVTDAQILPLQPGERILCREAYVPSLPGSEGCSPPWALDFLRSQLLPHRARRVPSTERLYIPRGQASGRPVVNEDRLISKLEARGFVTIDPGALSVAEQMALFQDAQLIVAPHGAALSNLVFSERAKVLELFSQDYLRLDCYFTLARLRGLEYRCWIDPTPPGRADPWGAIRVDTDAVERALDALERA